MYLQDRIFSLWLTLSYSNWPHIEFGNWLQIMMIGCWSISWDHLKPHNANCIVWHDHKLVSFWLDWFSFKVTFPAEMNLIQTLTIVLSDVWVLSDSSSGALDLIVSRVKLLSPNKSFVRMVFWNEMKVLAMGFLKERFSCSWKKPFGS